MDKNMFTLSGKISLVVGGCGNIGRAISRALAQAGATVIISDINENESIAFADELATLYKTDCYGFGADQTSPEDVEKLGEFCHSTGQKLDVVVHSVGIISSAGLSGYAVDFEKQTLEAWKKALDVNLTSVFLLAKKIYPLLIKGKTPASFILLSSIYGFTGPDMSLYEGTDMGNPLVYGVTKGGIIQFTRYLATTWAPRIRVNCVSPGGVKRGQPLDFITRYERSTPMGRMATPEDIAGPVIFLASDASSYITGQNIIVDGGKTSW